MQHNIRLFTPDDYEQLANVINNVFSEYPDSVDEIRFWDEHRDPKCKFQRWVAEVDGRIVAFAEHNQFSGMYHPRKFIVDVGVLPDYRGRGIGSALYDHVVDTLQPFDPLSLRARAREDWTHTLRFLKRRGYREDMRAWESRLDVAAFDPTPYAGLDDKVRAHEIEIKTFRELESDPERNRKLYELEEELDRDVPSPEPHTAISYKYFVEHRLNNPGLLPDAFFVALHDGEYVGMSNLWSSEGNDDIYTGLTAVKRAYRRKGIALALKLRGIQWVKANGNPIIKTWNESNNRPMLSINEQLGYVKQPAWIDFVKVLKQEEPQETVTLAHAKAM